MLRFFLFLVFLISTSYAQEVRFASSTDVGACQMDGYLPELKGKKIALVINQTSFIGKTHLLDTLLKLGIKVTRIYAPEHGFRGNADAGEKIDSYTDSISKVPVVSLYGKRLKPDTVSLQAVDLVLFDIQDVGVRFYTYISTLHYVMEACAELKKSIIVLDRPNPNIHYEDGPVLDMKFASFVGMHPVPIVYGMTIGEYAYMINGEGWLKNGVRADLKVVRMRNYHRNMRYSLPIKPSPNLPNDLSIALYPSLCLFEGTNISVGRGTFYPFQVIGHPDYPVLDFSFTPISIEGMSRNPPSLNKRCYGLDLRAENLELKGIRLQWLLSFYEKSKTKETFFNKFFVKLAGTDLLQQQIQAGLSEYEIKRTWQKGLEQFREKKKKYLLYD